MADMHPFGPPRARQMRWQVVMAHGHYVPPAEWPEQSHRSWKFSDAAIRDLGADYVALGHWDRATQVGDGSVPAYYSGSPDLAETVNVVILAPGNATRVARERLDWGATPVKRSDHLGRRFSRNARAPSAPSSVSAIS